MMIFAVKKSSLMILKRHLWLILQNQWADPQCTLVTQRKSFLLSPEAKISFLPILSLSYFSFPAPKPHLTWFQTQPSQFLRLDASDLSKLRHKKSNVQATERSHFTVLSFVLQSLLPKRTARTCASIHFQEDNFVQPYLITTGDTVM